MAILHHFGNLDLTEPPRARDRVFFNVLPRVVVHYSYAWVVPLAVLITVGMATLVVVGIRNGRLQTRHLLTATAVLGFGTVGAIVFAALLWIAIRTVNTDHQVTLVGSYQTDVYLVALALATFAFMATIANVLKRLGSEGVLTGAMLAWLPLLWAVTLLAPAMSYVATWPLLFATVPVSLRVLGHRGADAAWTQVAVLGVAGLPALVLLPATLHQAVGLLNRFEGAAGLPVFGLTMVFIAPVVLLLLPQLDMLVGGRGRNRWVIPVVGGLCAAAIILWANGTSGFDAERPRPNHLSYALDADRGEARWVSFDRHLDHWTSRFIPAGTSPSDYETVAWGTFRAYAAPAPASGLPAPQVDVTHDEIDKSARTVGLRISSPRGASHMRVRIEAREAITSATLDRRSLDLKDYRWAAEGVLLLNYANVPESGFELVLVLSGTGSLTITLDDSTIGFPAGLEAIPQRPGDTMPSPLYRRDSTDVRRQVTL